MPGDNGAASGAFRRHRTDARASLACAAIDQQTPDTLDLD
jgi:hypothetical protein